MAARLNRLHQDTVRQKIQADKIILSLQKHVDGLSELTPTQIQAAKILLDKSISNAPQIVEQTLSGELTIKKIERVIVDSPTNQNA